MKKSVLVVLAVAALVAMTSFARAEEGAWQWRLTPYAWAMGMDGDVGVHGVTAPIEVDFLDAVDELDMAGMMAVEANNGAWGLLLDGAYLRLDDSSDTAIGEVDVEVEQWIVQASALYTASKTEKTVFDAGAGARWIEQDTDISSAVADADGTEGWGDPVLVARVRHQFAEKCFGTLYGDIGGFGVSSELTWQLIAATGYTFTEGISGVIAYRYLDYDYDEDGFVYDVAASGLALGLQFDM